EAVLPTVRQLAAEHPLDEPLQALLLRALRDAGRAAEALAAYEDIRARLAERLGTDPGAELRALHTELLSGGHPAPPSPSAPSTPPAAPSSPSPSHHAPSPSHHAPAPSHHTPTPMPMPAPAPTPKAAQAPAPAPADPRHPGAPRAADAPRTPGGAVGRGAPRVPAGVGTPGALRARLTSFVGREEEIRVLGKELGAARLVTLTGPGGAGKTRLSLEAAARASAGPGSGWEDGVWVVELAAVREQDGHRATAEAVLTALGGRETVLTGSTAEGLRAAADPAAGDPLAQLAEYCAARRMLLVLDNCEHLIDAAARVVETLLVECPGVTVLATSREPLGVPGESVRPVGPLPDPVALRLLADRGASARPGFSTDEDPEACAEICRRLDGLPLAIELAAARLRSLTPRQLAQRLDHRFRLLTSGSRTVLPRQQTLRAVVDWSWELLGERERAVLRRLSVFAGGCALEQAEEVCADLDPAGEEAGGGIAALLGSLVDKSLVTAVPGEDTGGMRYRLLETVAEYAAEKLEEVPGERERAERRHLVAYRELARTADPLLRGPRQAAWLERLEREHDNLRTALRRALAARDEHEALCMVLSLNWFWQLRGHRGDRQTWATASLALGPDPFASPVRPAPPLYESCTQSPPPMSEELLWEARRGVRLMLLTDAEEGIEQLRSPERQAELRNITRVYSPGMPQVCRLPGCMWLFAWLMTDSFDALRRLADAAVEGCRRLGYEWELAYVLQLRTKITSDRPASWDQAAADAAESLEIFRRVGDAWGEAEALSGRAEALTARGRFAEAAEDCRLAIARAELLGAHSQVPYLKARLGSVLVELDDPEQAAEGERLLRKAAEEAERLPGDGPNFAAIQLAVHLTRTGEAARARELLEPLEAEFEDRAPQLFAGMVQGILAWTYLVSGEPAEALAKVRVSIGKTRDLMADAITPHLTLSQLLTAARALAALGRGEEAGRLLGAYDSLTGLPPGCFPLPVERESRQAAERAVREALPQEAFAAAHAAGDGLRLEEAVALVREA
ncbi:AfsR/SARP family transcriptional regulator, partial [Streptomyces albus subsp. chlorinus]